MEREGENQKITLWHQLFAEMLTLMLQRLGVTVVAEYNVLTHPPRADVLLLRRETAQWTEEQLRFLPSGIRESSASHTLVEFKKTESLTDTAVLKIAAYDIFLRDNNDLRHKDVLPVIVCAKHPQNATRKRLGFVETDVAGVFQNENPLAKRVMLISLNHLADTPHNAYFKLLASQRQSLNRAFSTLQQASWEIIPYQLLLFLAKLVQSVLNAQGDELMVETITAEEMIAEGEALVSFILSALPPEKKLEGLTTQERLSGIPVKERLSGISAEELRAFLDQLEAQQAS